MVPSRAGRVALVVFAAACTDSPARTAGDAGLLVTVIHERPIEVHQYALEVFEGARAIHLDTAFFPASPTGPLASGESIGVRLFDAPDRAMVRVQVMGLLRGIVVARGEAAATIALGEIVPVEVRLDAPAPPDGGRDGGADAGADAALPCGPATCDGCCLGGSCVAPGSTTDAACGSGGVPCVDCAALATPTSCAGPFCAGCARDCDTETCGPDDCGSSCGSCADPTPRCGEAQQCDCPDVVCGDACCDAGQVCAGGACCTRSCDAACSADDGCGGWCDGPCPDPDQACGPSGCGCPGVECGGDCCPGGQVCHVGACCAPRCDGTCGGDGCGGWCDSACPDPDESCEAGKCVCRNALCGADCCAPGQTCFGGCCAPRCDGTCGDDGCGGPCDGACPDPDRDCDAGACVCRNALCRGDCCAPGEICFAGDCCRPSCPSFCATDGCGGPCGGMVCGGECCPPGVACELECIGLDCILVCAP